MISRRKASDNSLTCGAVRFITLLLLVSYTVLQTLCCHSSDIRTSFASRLICWSRFSRSLRLRRFPGRGSGYFCDSCTLGTFGSCCIFAFRKFVFPPNKDACMSERILYSSLLLVSLRFLQLELNMNRKDF